MQSIFRGGEGGGSLAYGQGGKKEGKEGRNILVSGEIYKDFFSREKTILVPLKDEIDESIQTTHNFYWQHDGGNQRSV